jgi:hypothetical protein
MLKNQARKPREKTWTSDWLVSIVSYFPELSESFEYTFQMEKTSYSGVLVERMSFEYKSRIAIASSLFFSFSAGLTQSLAFYETGRVNNLGYSIGLEAKVVF